MSAADTRDRLDLQNNHFNFNPHDDEIPEARTQPEQTTTVAHEEIATLPKPPLATTNATAMKPIVHPAAGGKY